VLDENPVQNGQHHRRIALRIDSVLALYIALCSSHAWHVSHVKNVLMLHPSLQPSLKRC
jgi:hypothetical protein